MSTASLGNVIRCSIQRETRVLRVTYRVRLFRRGRIHRDHRGSDLCSRQKSKKSGGRDWEKDDGGLVEKFCLEKCVLLQFPRRAHWVYFLFFLLTPLTNRSSPSAFDARDGAALTSSPTTTTTHWCTHLVLVVWFFGRLRVRRRRPAE